MKNKRKTRRKTKRRTRRRTERRRTRRRTKKPITDVNKFNKWVNKQETGISNKLFKNYFKFQRPSVMLEYLYKANASQNNELVSLINSGLKD